MCCSDTTPALLLMVKVPRFENDDEGGIENVKTDPDCALASTLAVSKLISKRLLKIYSEPSFNVNEDWTSISSLKF